MGGHVRVGLEDNIWYDDDRTIPATNFSLIDRIVKLAKAAGREIATPDEAREIIGLPGLEREAPEMTTSHASHEVGGVLTLT
jgi:3-keto-5-aminohexanoate cleavage enzyme